MIHRLRRSQTSEFDFFLLAPELAISLHLLCHLGNRLTTGLLFHLGSYPLGLRYGDRLLLLRLHSGSLLADPLQQHLAGITLLHQADLLSELLILSLSDH